MGFADMPNTGLGLGLGLGLHQQSESCRREIRLKKHEDPYKCDQKLCTSLTLGPPDDLEANEQLLPAKTESVHFRAIAASSSPSAASSFSNSSSIKRENKESVGDELDLEVDNKVNNPSKVGLDVDEDGNPRKKLRLTKEQSTVLEDSFKDHSTLNPKQKQELARKLNLRARQVEVWFQNRRARTKLKQTEVDCELLKKCCKTLTEENRRLQKELQELRSMKTTSQGPLYMQLPAATLTLCPSCERICGEGGGTTANGSPATTAFLTGSKAHPLYKSNYPFTHSSAAC